MWARRLIENGNGLPITLARLRRGFQIEAKGSAKQNHIEWRH
jgi:hypothetical protein